MADAVKHYRGERVEVTAALCRCGATANAPFCDGAGDCGGWRERGAELDGSQASKEK